MFSSTGGFSFGGGKTTGAEGAKSDKPVESSPFSFGSLNLFGSGKAAGKESTTSLTQGKSLFGSSTPLSSTSPNQASSSQTPPTPQPPSPSGKASNSLFPSSNLFASPSTTPQGNAAVSPNPNDRSTPNVAVNATVGSESKGTEVVLTSAPMETGAISSVAITGKTLVVLEKVEQRNLGDSGTFAYTALRCCRLDGSLVQGPATSPHDASAPEYEEISCWPCLPVFRHAPLSVEFNADGTLLLIVSASSVAVIRFQPLKPLAALSNPVMRRKQTNSTLQGVYRSGDRTMSLKGTWKCMGPMGSFQDEVVSLYGSVDPQAGEMLLYAGELSGTKKGTFRLWKKGAGFEDGSNWANEAWCGTVCLEVAGSAPVEMPMQLLVLERCAGREEGDSLLRCSVGRAQVSMAQSWCMKEVTWGGWYPLSATTAHFVLLTADGHIRMFDAHQDLEDSVHEMRIQRETEAAERSDGGQHHRYVACSFGNPSSSVDTKVTEAIVWKRLTLFVLRSDGAVLALCPYTGPGIHIISSQELAPLRALVKENLATVVAGRDDASDYDDDYEEYLNEQLQWLHGRKKRFPPRTRLLAPLSQPPHTASHACSFAVLPVRDSSAFIVLRAWTDATVDVLFGGAPIGPMWERSPTKSMSSPNTTSSATAVSVVAKESKTPDTTDIASPETPSRSMNPKNIGLRIKEAIAERNEMIQLRDRRRGLSARKSSDLSSYASNDSADEDARDNVGNSMGERLEDPAKLNVMHGLLCLVHRVRVSNLVAGSRAELRLVPDVVYSDVCLCIDTSNGSLALLWLPFLDKLKRALSGEPAAQQDALYTNDSQFWLCFGRPLTGVQIDAGTTRANCALGVGPAIGHYVLAATKQGIESLELSSHCISLRAMRASAGEKLLKDDEIAGDSVDAAREEVPTVDHVFQQLLEDATRVPEQLQGLRFDDESVAPALQIAGVKWLQETFNVLTIGKGKRIGLLAGIQARLEELDATRIGQDAAFVELQKALKEQQEEVEELHKENTALSMRCAKLLDLQKVTEEALEDATVQARAINPKLTPAERRFHARVVRAEERVHALLERSNANSGLERRVDSIIQTEMAQNKQLTKAQQAVEFTDKEVEAQVKDLQSRTSARIGMMMQVETSLLSLRERVEKLRETIQPVMTLGSWDSMLVLLVCLNSREAEKISHRIAERQALSKLFLDKDIVGRGYQSMVRRQLGLNADKYPYHLRIGRAGRDGDVHSSSDVELIRIILLDQAATLVTKEDGAEKDIDVRIGLRDGGDSFGREWVKVKALRRASKEAGVEVLEQVEQLRDLFKDLVRIEQELLHDDADAFADVHFHFKHVL